MKSDIKYCIFTVMLYCTVLYHTLQYCTIQHCSCTVLYFTILHYTVLYRAVLYVPSSCLGSQMNRIRGMEIETFIVNKPDLRLTSAAITISISHGKSSPVCTLNVIRGVV